MKIVAISDLHGYLPEIEKCDMLIIAGDISPILIQGNISAMTEWLFGEFMEWINKLPCDDVVLVPGNHDFWFERNKKGPRITSLIVETKAKLSCLFNTSKTFYDENANKITIFGTPYCSIYGNWPFMREDSVLEQKFSQIPEDIDILVSHDPPFGICDIDICHDAPYKGHIGNKPLSIALMRVKPKYVICGHIHTGEHFPITIYGTTYVNVSLLDEKLNLKYNPYIFNYEKS